MWRYGYFSLPYANQDIYFYLVHTSSPDSYSHFVMRNDQLTTFVNDFKSHEVHQKHSNIVMVGDFNVTPWSPSYRILSTGFSGELSNITKRAPFLFTRAFKMLPLFQAHIDHVWTSAPLRVEYFKVITMP
ncbi:MAG: endonuclease/exonuclease/phosphatase family protein [bacterium]